MIVISLCSHRALGLQHLCFVRTEKSIFFIYFDFLKEIDHLNMTIVSKGSRPQNVNGLVSSDEHK